MLGESEGDTSFAICNMLTFVITQAFGLLKQKSDLAILAVKTGPF
jgi:hypothetical protein